MRPGDGISVEVPLTERVSFFAVISARSLMVPVAFSLALRRVTFPFMHMSRAGIPLMK